MTVESKQAETVEHAVAGESWCPAGQHWTPESVLASPYNVGDLCCFKCFMELCHLGAFPISTVPRD